MGLLLEAQKEKIIELENLIRIKDTELEEMEIKMLKLENENIFNQEDSDLNTKSSSSDDEDLVVEQETGLSENESSFQVH